MKLLQPTNCCSEQVHTAAQFDRMTDGACFTNARVQVNSEVSNLTQTALHFSSEQILANFQRCWVAKSTRETKDKTDLVQL